MTLHAVVCRTDVPRQGPSWRTATLGAPTSRAPLSLPRACSHVTLEAVARESPLGREAARLEQQATRALDEATRSLEAVARDLRALPPSDPRRAPLDAESRELRGAQARARKRLAAVAAKLEESRRAALRSAEVVVATCSASGDRVVAESGLVFPLVVVDEAAQVPEPQCWIPLVQGAQSVVLAGDPRQLPPTVLSQGALEAGLDYTLFDRVADAGLAPLLLDVQYRMHPSIVQVPSELFYDGRLRTGLPAGSRPPLPGVPWPGRGAQVALWAVAGREQRDRDQSWLNEQEAEAVYGLLVRAMQSRDFVAERPTVAVLTPYGAQARLLQKRLAAWLDGGTPLPAENVFVSTGAIRGGYGGLGADTRLGPVASRWPNGRQLFAHRTSRGTCPRPSIPSRSGRVPGAGGRSGDHQHGSLQRAGLAGVRDGSSTHECRTGEELAAEPTDALMMLCPRPLDSSRAWRPPCVADAGAARRRRCRGPANSARGQELGCLAGMDPRGRRCGHQPDPGRTGRMMRSEEGNDRLHGGPVNKG